MAGNLAQLTQKVSDLTDKLSALFTQKSAETQETTTVETVAKADVDAIVAAFQTELDGFKASIDQQVADGISAKETELNATFDQRVSTEVAAQVAEKEKTIKANYDADVATAAAKKISGGAASAALATKDEITPTGQASPEKKALRGREKAAAALAAKLNKTA